MTQIVNYRCAEHPDPFDCPDCLIYYEPRFDEYGIIIHDGGSCYDLLRYCPFCGARLPESQRDLWLQILTDLGIQDPWTDPIPPEYQTGQWYR